MMPSSRSDAKSKGVAHYFTGEPCRNGHTEPRITSCGTCMACAREKSSKWANLNREKLLEGKAAAYVKRAVKNRQYASEWRKNNQGRKNATQAARNAMCKKQTPSWADREQISMWYEVAKVLGRSGVKFHVDHVLPLRGKNVCGMHTHDNLQILPWHFNLRKGNKNGN